MVCVLIQECREEIPSRIPCCSPPPPAAPPAPPFFPSMAPNGVAPAPPPGPPGEAPGPPGEAPGLVLAFWFSPGAQMLEEGGGCVF